jgi:hypothetical protein
MFFSFQTEKAAVRRAPLITSTWLLPCCLLFHKYRTVLWSAILLLISLLKIKPQPSSGYIGLRHQNFSTVGSHLYGGDQGVGAASIAQMSSLMWLQSRAWYCFLHISATSVVLDHPSRDLRSCIILCCPDCAHLHRHDAISTAAAQILYECEPRCINW